MRSSQQVGPGDGIVYVVVGAVLAAAALLVARGHRSARRVAVVALGGRVAAVAGTTWGLTLATSPVDKICTASE